jgi:hypothetical protein
MNQVPQDALGSVAASQPAPVGGWNTRDPLDGMPESDAVTMDNMFPEPSKVSLRNGFTSHATGMTGDVQTLAEFVEAGQSSCLIAAADNKIWDATSSGAASNITGSTTPSSDKWQTVNFGGVLVMVNGADVPQKVDTGPAVSDITYTGSGLTPADLIDVTSYKSRLYLVEKNTASVWYTAVDSAGGTVTEFALGSLLKRGGDLQWVSSWTRDSGSGSQDLLVLCSNKGEVLVYEGDNPGASNWSLFGRFFLPVPLGRRSKIEYGSDLLVITEQGVVPLSKVLAGNEEITLQFSFITDKIQDAFRSVAAARGTNFGWEGQLYPRGNFLLINIPVTENTSSHQYVMNTLTGAWCRFTGQDAFSWSLLSEELYFGGNGGVVYKSDNGSNDNGSNISVTLKTAFNFFNDRILEKRFVLARPHISSDTGTSFAFGLDVDFQDSAVAATVTATSETGMDWGDTWDTKECAGS